MAGAPLLSELMPWSVPGLRAGREWVRSAHPEVLAARWRRLAEAEPAQRAELFRASRSRSVESAVAQLPGQTTPTLRLARDPGPAPEPVRIRHGAFDRLWLLADQRLLDRARPELWRVADPAQVFATVQPFGADGRDGPGDNGPAVTFSAELPDGYRTKGLGRIHPLYRRPGGRDPNVAPGLTGFLSRRLGAPVSTEDLLAWIAAATAHPVGRTGEQVPVPLPGSGRLWDEGVALGRRVLWLHSFGARSTDTGSGSWSGTGPRAGSGGAVRMPAGRRPFVRERVAGFPEELEYDPEAGALVLGSGRLAPVASSAWEFRAAGSRVLGEWFRRRGPDPDARPGSLEALGLTGWPQQFTAELVDLVTVLTLLAELRPALAGLLDPDRGPWITTEELVAAGVLPVPESRRRPASVLLHREEGPEGQFALL